MRIRVLQHVPFEGPGHIQNWADSRGHSVAVTHLYAGDPPPALDDFDWLVIMGGPMSVNDPLPWIPLAKRLIEQSFERDKIVLGICLGAQLIASTLGARVYCGEFKEIGWFRVYCTPAATTSPLFQGVPKSFLSYHWHGETFDLPAGAKHLAMTLGCGCQAFAYGPRGLALQFHLEMTECVIRDLSRECGGDLPNGRYVQPTQSHLEQPERLTAMHKMLDRILDNLAASAV
ncbi:type 1 glutamine amidotransferase [Planctomicrobium piriforme]|uniref:GMP synthase-Glutamine amidotransferase n=1 Tax=Planctomicrobium piriforme TaxID=1576369 RepID=A0A1I3NFR3_9PLAN|nr:type 1 glutamine amidotransferase [Planctomicrobium piriforme]SFJ08171.1 GMP synthase-Glutamine amidotransferase [Planctomicrobium piriforme]